MLLKLFVSFLWTIIILITIEFVLDGGQGIRRLSYDWSSVESNDTSDNVFVSSGATAERRRECYRSTSRNGSYGKQTASSSMGSMDENKALSECRSFREMLLCIVLKII